MFWFENDVRELEERSKMDDTKGKCVFYGSSSIKKEIDKSDSNLYFVDVYQHMLNEHNYPITDYYSENGLHLSRKGYELWRDEILKYERELFGN